jgi:hypothetical protein
MPKLEKIDLATVKEEIQKGSASQTKRTDKSLDTKEKELFERMYPMTRNEDLAKQFLISTEDVERLAHALKVYTDQAFTQHQMVKAKEGSYLNFTNSDGSTATPGFLITEVTKKLTEEERREIVNNYIEHKDPLQSMRELAFVQEQRLVRGLNGEAGENQNFRVVNDIVDTLHQIYKSLFEMEHGTKQTHVLTVDEMILKSQNINR